MLLFLVPETVSMYEKELNLEEAREVCNDRTKWRFVVSA